MDTEQNQVKTAQLEKTEEVSRPKFVLQLLLLVAVMAGVIVVCFYAYGGLFKWHDSEMTSRISSDEPLLSSVNNTSAFIVNAIIGVSAVAFMALAVFIRTDDSSVVFEWILGIVLLSGVIFGFVAFAFGVESRLTTNDSAVQEWASDRYGVELVGTSDVSDGHQILLDNGNQVTFTLLETSEGPAYILTQNDNVELPLSD